VVGLLEEGFLLSRIVGADRGTGERERERVVRTRRGGGGGVACGFFLRMSWVFEGWRIMMLRVRLKMRNRQISSWWI